MNQFNFEGVKKTLVDGIVPIIIFPSHAGFHTMGFEDFSITVRGILTAPIAWKMTPLAGFRFQIGISLASLTKSVFIRESMVQPTTVRENRWMTVAKNNQSSLVEM